jgi:hypothetical protein
MTIEISKTPLGGYPAMLHDENVAFSEALRKFVRKVGALPPLDAYRLHPAFDPLVDLLKERRASWEGAFDGEACEICRSFLRTEDGYICQGGTSEELLSDRASAVAHWRQYPREQPSKWREVARVRSLIAELVSPEPPNDHDTFFVWLLLGRANYVPHISDLTRKAGWKA